MQSVRYFHLTARQELLPPGAYLPLAQKVGVDDPSQAEPASHRSHCVRVVSSAPPVVLKPGEQTEHAPAPAELNFLPSPHGEHTALPAPLNLPAGQIV